MYPVFIACQVERKDVPLAKFINVPCIYRMPGVEDVPLAECLNVPCIYRMPGEEEFPLAEFINVPCNYRMPDGVIYRRRLGSYVVVCLSNV